MVNYHFVIFQKKCIFPEFYIGTTTKKMQKRKYYIGGGGGGGGGEYEQNLKNTKKEIDSFNIN